MLLPASVVSPQLPPTAFILSTHRNQTPSLSARLPLLLLLALLWAGESLRGRLWVGEGSC